MSGHAKIARLRRLLRLGRVEFADRWHRAQNHVESISLSVVIPVFNEAENVQPLVERLQAALRESPGQIEMLFVDDGSTDRTLALFKQPRKKIRASASRTFAVISARRLRWRRGFVWREERRW